MIDLLNLHNFCRAGRIIVSRLVLVGLCLVVVCTARSAFGIDPERALTQALIRKWQFSQGLPQPRVLAITQTRDGRLWLGTQSGLFLFDGLRFWTYRPTHGDLPANLWVQQMLEDPSQRLWIATMGDGLYCLNRNTCESFGLESGLPSLNVQCLLIGPDGDLWVGTDRGLVRRIGGRFIPVSEQEGLTVQNVRALAITSEGTLCVGGDAGQLNLWRDGQFLTRPLSTISPLATIRALLGTPDGNLWIGTNEGLVRLDESGEARIGRAQGLADDFVETLMCTSDGQIWVGTRDGLSRLVKGEIETIRARDGLSQSTVCALAEDHENSLWIGTKNGLNQLVDRRTLPWTANEGLPSNETGALIQDSEGDIWIGTLDAGLARHYGRRCNLVADAESGLPGNQIRSLERGPDGEVWVGTDRGLCRLKGSRIESVFTTEQGLPDLTINCLYRDEHQTLWAGTGRGLARMEKGQFTTPFSEEQFPSVPVRVMLDSPLKEGLIVATDGFGMFHCHGDEVIPLWHDVPELRCVTALMAGPGQRVWAGTRGEGLFLLTPDKAVRMTVRQGLFDDEIFGIVDDRQGRIWMACSRGIFFVPESELLELAEGRRDSVNSTQFSPLEALRTIECQQGVQPSVWRMNDGKLWFSTVHGVLMIDPVTIFRKLPPPPLSIELMQVNGENVDPGERLTLPAGSNNIMFRYTSFSLTYPHRVKFQYRLEGFDADWIDAGSRREAYYTNLPPGRYRFQLKAANPENDWSSLIQTPEVTIRPYFYRTIWFYGLVGIILAIGVWGHSRFREMQVRNRMNAALAERMRIARDLHDTLIQGFSGVTMQMQALVARLKNSSEKEALQDVINDAGRCLREARQTVIGLRHAPESSTCFVDSLTRVARQLTETHPVELQLRIPSELAPMPSEVEYNLLKIAQEAIVNAIKHASATTLTVSLDSEGRQLKLSIVDNGQGFAQQIDTAPVGHYGLIGMRERAHHIDGTLTIDSRPGQGTSVTVVLSQIPESADPLAGGNREPQAMSVS